MKEINEIQKMKKLIGRIALDWFLLVGIFIPFVFVIHHVTASAVPGGLFTFSLSTFGWKVGLWWVLAIYAIFIAGFAVYKAIVFSKISIRRDIAVRILVFTGAFLILFGSALPVNDYHDFFDRIHGHLCQIGILLVGVAAIIMIYRYWRDTNGNMVTFIIPIIVFLVLGAIGFIEFRTGGHFQIALALGAMVMLSYITTKYEIAPKKDIKPVDNGASMLLSWLSFIIPFLGFILYFRKRKTANAEARVYLYWAIACIGLWLILAGSAYFAATHSCVACGIHWRCLIGICGPPRCPSLRPINCGHPTCWW